MDDPLLERLNTAYHELAGLERKRPGTAAEFSGLIIELTRIAEEAYGRTVQLLKPMREHFRLPRRTTRDRLRRDIASSYDYNWIHNVARISDSLGALRIAYTARLLDLQAAYPKRALDGLFNAIYEGEHGFELSIRSAVLGVGDDIGNATSDAGWELARRRSLELIEDVETALRALRTTSETITRSVDFRNAARGQPHGVDSQTDVMVVTVNKYETRAITQAFEKATGAKAESMVIENRVYRNLGLVNGWRIIHALSEMGSGGLGGAHQTVDLGIRALNPKAVVAVGIAFGVDKKRQTIGEILVSRQLRLYEAQRIGQPVSSKHRKKPKGRPIAGRTRQATARKSPVRAAASGRIILRGDRPHAAPRLVNLFEGVAQTNWRGQKVTVGVILSGEKLVDDIDWRKQLQAFEKEAIGGEMEGAGVYVASEGHKTDWIVIKAICDWADGHKGRYKTERQEKAAMSAATFFLHALRQVPPGEEPAAGGQSRASTRRSLKIG
jgi:nucleoside phosphorylase